MPEMCASDVPGRWRFFLYVSALCGYSNVYRCYWLPRWLRRLSVGYQISMLIINIIVIGVALADAGPTLAFDLAFRRYIELLVFVIIALSNIAILWQTYCGSGTFLLFQTRKDFEAGDLYAVKHQTWCNVITLIVGLLVLICEPILTGICTWLVMKKHNVIASFIFPVLNGRSTQKLMFGVYVMTEVSILMFLCCYMLLCFVILVDITFLFRTLREEMDVAFSGPVVDESAVERYLQTIRGICELVDAADGTFGVPLALYLMWIVPTIINIALQLLLSQDYINPDIYHLVLLYAVVLFVLILVPPAVMAAQVKGIPHGGGK